MAIPRGSHSNRSASYVAVRWAVFCILLLLFILVPFFLLEGQLTAVVRQALQSSASIVPITAAVIGFLVADILLPVPSSFVLSTTGYLLGLTSGTLVCFLGMTFASVTGYLLGRYASVPVVRRVMPTT
jgi:uncharacterized membrane protein YdjX (TVP38/TMEM64 family)